MNKVLKINNLLLVAISGLLLFSCSPSAKEKRVMSMGKYNEALNVYSNSVFFSTLNNDTINKVINLLDEAIKIDPKYSFSYCKKASMQSKLGNNEEGIQTLTLAAEKLGENNTDLLIQKAVLYERMNLPEELNLNYEKLITLFDEAIKINPNDFYAVSNRAVVVALYKGIDAGLQILKDINYDKLQKEEQVQLRYMINVFEKNDRQLILDKLDL
ncbi:tetratricopeptide (TPR) repeat protein [Dysgonomonadaceae bacterium PH5-43]|nr:tetratricopeptide (TPR) repeat protein [Dysgonomonadaceae bacterium PH5-43]